MAQPLYSLGLDYGTNTVRALVVDVADGREIGTGVAPYPHGEAGVVIDERQPLLARQHPADYETALEEAVREALGQCRRDGDFDPARIVGIGLDATASTPLPVDATAAALALDARFASDPDAMAWLWKDHTAHAEAEEITDLARRECPEWLARSGNAYSSEWYFAKLLRLRRAAPQVLEAAAGWVELGDHVVGRLVGCGSPDELRRGVCAAGHKALYHETRGLPPLGFFQQLDGELGRWLEGKLYSRAHASDTAAGRLSASWAARLGLPSGTPVAVAAIDAHIGAVGAGVRPGVLVKILGTSACDMLVHPAAEEALGEIPGISGTVLDSILPGHWGIEAGQSAVGDIFGWFVREFGRPAGLDHEELTAASARLGPGESGLLVLDWHNGNRCLLGDPLLSGLLVGQTLRTRPHEVYRALIEGTAFGARLIVDRIAEHGVPVNEVIVCGGIAEKNSMLLELYADILERPLKVSGAEQTCALGAAIFGAVVAGPATGTPGSLEEAVSRMTSLKDRVYRPDPGRASVYAELRELYRALHDAFGTPAGAAGLHRVMKRLLEIQSRCRT